MKQDMIVILDLGSHENTVLARAIRALGVYSEIYPHDITVEELKALPNVKGIIINGGPNNVIDGVAIDVNPAIYTMGLPVIAAGHDKATCTVKLPEFTDDIEAIKAAIKSFVFDTCQAEANWNMANFVNDQIELIKRQVGDKKVLLALSGGVDSSVVAALLLKAIGNNLVCVHVNHGLMRKGESEDVVEVFSNQLKANLIYVDVTDRFLNKLAGVEDPEQKRKIIGEEFIGDGSVAMVLGDNIFAGHGLKKRLKAAIENAESGRGATVFGYYVDDPERFGIVEFDKNGKAVSIEEKPAKPKSNYCVTGLYFYDNRVVKYAKNLKPSARGELEITDLNRIYLEENQLNVELLGQGFTWLDTGTHESLVEATNFVKTIEQHQHRKIACLEEIAYLNGWISKEDVLKVYELLKKNQYGQYLKDVLDGKYMDVLH